MPADISTYSAVLKEVWTQDRLEKQFYDSNVLLDALEKTSKYHIGDRAVVPVHVSRNGGYSAVPPTGSDNLNPPGNQGTKKAEFRYTRHWMQIKLDSALIEQTGSSDVAIANGVDTEVNGALDDLRHQLGGQSMHDGTGFLAVCGTTTAANVVNLAAGTADWTLDRGYLYPGVKVDIGTTSSESSLAADREVTAVDVANRTITIDGAAVTTTGSHRVSIANSRSGTDSYTMNGLENIVGTGLLGGIDGATNPAWRSVVDTSNVNLDLATLLGLQRKIFQKTGVNPDWNVTSTLQQQYFYMKLQQQVRFAGEGGGFGAGDQTGPKWNGMTIDAQPDAKDEKWYMLTKKNLFMVRTDKPKWASVGAGGGVLQWVPNTTRMWGGVEYFSQLATNRRNAHGVLSNLLLTPPA